MSNADHEPGMQRLNRAIREAQDRFGRLLESYLILHQTTPDQYIRFLSFQYHLTKGVQRYFFSIASHSDLARRRRLRAFLTSFAKEEELHYLVAANDLNELGILPLPMPLDVELWHAYFTGIVVHRPFVRLGAAAILENISDGSAKEWVVKALRGPFLNRENTKFLVLHQHETLPHGDQIMEAIASGDLDTRQFDDIVEGAKKATVMYLRMAEWAVRPECLSSLADSDVEELDSAEVDLIKKFQMHDLANA